MGAGALGWLGWQHATLSVPRGGLSIAGGRAISRFRYEADIDFARV
jgi:hypothetical protein